MTRQFIQDCLDCEEDLICLGYIDTITKDVAEKDVDLRQLVIERLAHCCGWCPEIESNGVPVSISIPIQPKHICPINYDRLYEHRRGCMVVQQVSTERTTEIVSSEKTIPKITL